MRRALPESCLLFRWSASEECERWGCETVVQLLSTYLGPTGVSFGPLCHDVIVSRPSESSLPQRHV
jgi:hypothetical protein